MVEVEKEYASKGVAGSGLGLGIAGTALGLLNGGLGMLGGWNNHSGCCSENMPVTRYELGQESKISELRSQIALRDANTYGDQKLLELYKYVDGQLDVAASATPASVAMVSLLFIVIAIVSIASIVNEIKQHLFWLLDSAWLLRNHGIQVIQLALNIVLVLRILVKQLLIVAT